MVDKNQQVIDKTLDQEYKYGFTTDVDQTKFDPGLDEEVIKKLSKIKNEPQWLLDWRLKAFEKWKKIVYSEHPYAFNTIGNTKDVLKITHEDILCEFKNFQSREKFIISNDSKINGKVISNCLLYTSPSPRDRG